MSRSDQQRYDEAIAYVRAVDSDVADDINGKVGTQSKKVGDEISLAWAGYKDVGTPAQHTAVRALLLCQIVYFRPPHCRANLADTTVLKATRAAYLGKPEADVRSEIENYARPDTRSLDGLAQAAVYADQPDGYLDFVKLKRTDRHLGKNPICYNGVTLWLFAAGFVSKQWLGGPGNKIDANNADRAFGQGEPILPAHWGNIPAGYLWTIQRRGDPTTCHWGVSLGNGIAAATNNTPGSLVLMLDFIKGGSPYGTFDFEQICEVLNSDFKYGHRGGKEKPAAADTNIVVKQINPATSEALF